MILSATLSRVLDSEWDQLFIYTSPHFISSYSVIYLDYNATTPLEPEVIESIQDALTHAWGNPSSSHEAGKREGNT